ncbi:MAG TPA: hypothetical protein VFV38_29860 [Ktedonobacteraceae bacterium]|nr:hypothetical protein [Ktedonobacteraceae bacterium]
MATVLTLSRLMSYSVSDCPVCHTAHDYQLDIQYRKDIAVFEVSKNPASSPTTSPGWENSMTFICLANSNEHFTRMVTIAPETGEDIINVVLHVSSPSSNTSTDAPDETWSLDSILKEDLANSFKTSRSTVQDFCKTMITTATGAIAVFFAVLQFLGGSDSSGTAKVVTAILAGTASACFLLSALAYIFGLEPRYLARIDSLETYGKARERQLKNMNMYILAGTILFALGTLLAIFSFVFAYLKI